ncbi:hypothetical protein HWV62_6082 [Athelia sp. TMB]|nr:hypothetical protein HWV62_6082 [Athelia sp. TMB]
MTRHKQTEHGHPRRGEKGGSRVAHKTQVTTKDQDAPWMGMHRGIGSSHVASVFDTPGASSSALSSEALSTPPHVMSPTPTLPSHGNVYQRNRPATTSNEAYPAVNNRHTRFGVGAESAPGLLSSDTVSDLSSLAISSPTFATHQRASAPPVPHSASFPAHEEPYFLDLDAEEWAFMDWLKDSWQNTSH